MKMRDLDGLVTRATTRNDQHLSEHTLSLNEMAETVTTTFTNISAHAQETMDRSETFVSQTEAELNSQRSSLQPIHETLCQPLNDLQTLVTGTALSEYVPTGATPQKNHYKYPSELPRTAPRQILISSLYNQNGANVKDENFDTKDLVIENGEETAADADDDFHNELLDIMCSPSKPSNDVTTTIPVIFSDPDATSERPDTVAFVRASSQPPPSERLAPIRFSASSTRSMGMSLREVNPNLTTGSIIFETSTSASSSVQGVDENDTVSLDQATAGMETAATSMTASTSRGHTLPVYRRRSLRQTHNPPLAKQAKTRTSVMAPEGCENVPPSALSQSLSRRRSPRMR